VAIDGMKQLGEPLPCTVSDISVLNVELVKTKCSHARRRQNGSVASLDQSMAMHISNLLQLADDDWGENHALVFVYDACTSASLRLDFHIWLCHVDRHDGISTRKIVPYHFY
jgi:hypothetical protein